MTRRAWGTVNVRDGGPVTLDAATYTAARAYAAENECSLAAAVAALVQAGQEQLKLEAPA